MGPLDVDLVVSSADEKFPEVLEDPVLHLSYMDFKRLAQLPFQHLSAPDRLFELNSLRVSNLELAFSS